MLSRWKNYHARGLTLGEVRKLEGWDPPPEPSFVLEARKLRPHVDVRDIPLPTRVLAVMDESRIPDDVALPSICETMVNRVRFIDRPG
eukprot:6472207-Amphidinium_carterae.4